MEFAFSDKHKFIYTIVVTAIILLVYMFIHPFTYDMGDGVMHFLIAKYSWEHPMLLFDHWGKPFFTILASPFSQFGIKGIHAMQLCLSLLSGYSSAMVAKKISIKHWYLAPLFVSLTPILFLNTYTGLTEPLFAAIAIGSIALYCHQKYVWSLILISFLPLVRSEGFILISLWGAVALLDKQLIKTPLLLTGFVCFSILGGIIAYDYDFLWIFTRNPYATSTRYGSGPFSFYFDKGLFVFGRLQWILCLAGLATCIIQGASTFIRSSKPVLEKIHTGYILWIGFGLFFFFLHSFLWWKGLMAVLGQDRFMVCIVPEIVLCSLIFIDFIVEHAKKTSLVASNILLLSIICYFTIEVLNNKSAQLLTLNEPSQLILSSGKHASKNRPPTKKIFFSAPSYAVILNQDPYDTTMGGFMAPSSIPVCNKGDIVLWDAHFAGFEQKINPDLLLHSGFMLIRKYTPIEPVFIFRHEYKILVFERI